MRTLAATFGVAGLIPFIVATVLLWAGPAAWAPAANTVLVSYGACTLAFLGGIAWGFASAAGRPSGDIAPHHIVALAWSNLPALIAVAALLAPSPWNLVTLAGGYALTLAADLLFAGHGYAPSWFPRLRMVLTVVVGGCLAGALGYGLR